MSAPTSAKSGFITRSIVLSVIERRQTWQQVLSSEIVFEISRRFDARMWMATGQTDMCSGFAKLTVIAQEPLKQVRIKGNCLFSVAGPQIA